MLMRFDPFREFDRLLGQSGSGGARSFPMDAYRRGDDFIIHFDLPGVDPEQIDLTVDRNVLTVRAERHFGQEPEDEILITERPQGAYTRQVMLGDSLDGHAVTAGYDRGVLTLTIPVAEQAKPRKVRITAATDTPEDVSGTASEGGA